MSYLLVLLGVRLALQGIDPYDSMLKGRQSLTSRPELEFRRAAQTPLQKPRCLAAPAHKASRASLSALPTRLRVRNFTHDVLAGRWNGTALRLR
jgi:hypothetical protein